MTGAAGNAQLDTVGRDSAAAPVSAGDGSGPVANPLRERFEKSLRVLQSLRQPTVEQIERRLFLEDYFKKHPAAQ